MNKYEHISDNIEELISAVLVQASKDYMIAYKSNDKSKIKELEKFFHSDKFRDYTHDGISPDEFMKELRKQAKSPEIIHQKRKGDAPKNERIQD